MGAAKAGFRKHREAGISLVGLIVVLAVLGMVGITAAKVFPAWVEYRSIKSAIVSAKATGGSIREVQQSFSRNAEINNITAISAKDLVISRETGQTEVSFDYEKRIPLAGNVSLLIDFSGSTDPSGTAAGKPVTAAP
jgi:type II secretory pathway pseudopilin PulG